MIKRIITSSVLISIIFVTIFFFPLWIFSLVASIFIGLGISEFFRLNSKSNFPRLFIYIGVSLGMLLPYLTYFCGREGGLWEALFFIFSLIALFLVQFTRKENLNSITLIALTLFGIFYVGWFFSFLVKIRSLADGHKLVMYLLFVTKAGDVGAYLIGTRFGKHALIPRISPKKSIEGAIGGFMFSVAAALISRSFLGWMPFAAIFICGVIIGVFAQLGDLAESLVKRDYQVKDSSFFLPGLGGVLDVLDSVLFTAPIFYIYLIFIMKIG